MRKYSSPLKIFSLTNMLIFLKKRLFFTIFLYLFLDTMIGVALYLFWKKPTHHEGLRGKISVVSHPYKSYINKPGSSYYSLDGYTTNAYGHVVKSSNVDLFAKKKKHHEKRLLFLGGSTTYQPWPFYFGDILKSKYPNKDIHVINAGTGGYTSQENLIDLIISGFSYEPDIVIAYLPINDIYWSSIYPNFIRDYTHMRIPLQLVNLQAASEPKYSPRKYPFWLKFIDIMEYKTNYEKFLNAINLMAHQMKQPIPWPQPPKYGGYDQSFSETLSVIKENIFTLHTLCKARGIPFVLITQKIFKYPYGYNHFHKFAELMSELTIKANNSIAQSPELKNVSRIEMNNIFPNSWDDRKYIDKVKSYFGEKQLDYSEKMAYDDMHFNEAALHLFAVLVYESTQDVIVRVMSE